MRKVEFYWRFRIVGRVFDKLGMRNKNVSCFILFLKLHSSVFLDLQKKKDLQYMLYEGGFLFLCHIYYSSLLWTYLLHGYFHEKKKKCIFGSNESRQLLNFPSLHGLSLWCYAWHRCHRDSVSNMATVQSKKQL